MAIKVGQAIEIKDALGDWQPAVVLRLGSDRFLADGPYGEMEYAYYEHKIAWRKPAGRKNETGV